MAEIPKEMLRAQTNVILLNVLKQIIITLFFLVNKCQMLTLLINMISFSELKLTKVSLALFEPIVNDYQRYFYPI